MSKKYTLAQGIPKLQPFDLTTKNITKTLKGANTSLSIFLWRWSGQICFKTDLLNGIPYMIDRTITWGRGMYLYCAFEDMVWRFWSGCRFCGCWHDGNRCFFSFVFVIFVLFIKPLYKGKASCSLIVICRGNKSKSFYEHAYFAYTCHRHRNGWSCFILQQFPTYLPIFISPENNKILKNMILVCKSATVSCTTMVSTKYAELIFN